MNCAASRRLVYSLHRDARRVRTAEMALTDCRLPLAAAMGVRSFTAPHALQRRAAAHARLLEEKHVGASASFCDAASTLRNRAE